VEAFTPARSERCIETESRLLLHTKPAAPCPRKNLLRRKEIVRKNTGPQESTTKKKKTHPPENYKIGNNCTGPTMTTLTTCELIQKQAQ